MKPLVSIVMPAYNGDRFIGEAIESVLKQTYDSFELIVVDDKSEDHTVEVVKRYRDERIRLIYNDCNMGIAYSSNKAIDASKGKYIALLDDDDMAPSDRLAIQVDFLEKNREIAIVGGIAEMVDENGRHLSYELPLKNPNYIKAMLLIYDYKFANGTAMIRKSFLDNNQIRYRDGYYGMQDSQFYIECSKLGKITSIDKVFLKRRYHDKNESARQVRVNGKERAEAFARIRRNSLELSGYVLSEKEYQIMDKVFLERKPHFESAEEAHNFLLVFRNILDQAKQHKEDNIKEIELALKRKYTDIMYNSDIFQLL